MGLSMGPLVRQCEISLWFDFVQGESKDKIMYRRDVIL